MTAPTQVEGAPLPMNLREPRSGQKKGPSMSSEHASAPLSAPANRPIVSVRVSEPAVVHPIGAGTILITDDEPGIRASLCLFLGRLGYTVIEAADADTAVELLGRQRFDLVLSDIALPGTRTGLDLLAQVKQQQPDVDVILMTGHMDVDFAINAIKRGATDYFKKPFLFDELKHAVQRCIERRRLLEKARDLERLQSRHDALKGVQREFMVSLAAMIDAKSPYTRAHSERVSAYARHFGTVLGISDRELKIVTTGGRLHDIGKLGTPDSVINKPGRLDAAEWEIVKQHPICGAQLLEPIAMMRPYVPIVRSHHENFDGSGYPDRLKGDQIPLTVQIVKIADYYDAITSDRPYREPMTLREACDTLTSEIGKGFSDPLVTAFVAMLQSAPWASKGAVGDVQL
ncbi:MAG: response regulator [Planctomycetes bacterium]|nr:response regulator [Planctomycetota bacterium]